MPDFGSDCLPLQAVSNRYCEVSHFSRDEQVREFILEISNTLIHTPYSWLVGVYLSISTAGSLLPLATTSAMNASTSSLAIFFLMKA